PGSRSTSAISRAATGPAPEAPRRARCSAMMRLYSVQVVMRMGGIWEGVRVGAIDSPATRQSLSSRHADLGHGAKVEHFLEFLSLQQPFLHDQFLHRESRRHRFLREFGRLGVTELRG